MPSEFTDHVQLSSNCTSLARTLKRQQYFLGETSMNLTVPSQESSLRSLIEIRCAAKDTPPQALVLGLQKINLPGRRIELAGPAPTFWVQPKSAL